MVSLEFLYFFLPVFMGVYALSGVRFRKAVFLLGTVVLCLWVSTWGIIPMAVCAVVSYFCGRLIHRFADKKGLKKAMAHIIGGSKYGSASCIHKKRSQQL